MGATRTLIQRLLPLTMFFLAVMLPTAAAQTRLVEEGKHFERLKRVQPVESGNKIEVLEFFSYGCSHCWAFESELQAWLKTLPTDVQFRRVPVLFQEKWSGSAKIFYTLEALGAEDRISPDVFFTIHRTKIDLTQDKVFFEWAASNGLDRKNVEQAYGSIAVAAKVNGAKSLAQAYGSIAVGAQVNGARSLAQAYGVDEIPIMIIDGKFATQPHLVGSFGAMGGSLMRLSQRRERSGSRQKVGSQSLRSSATPVLCDALSLWIARC